MEPVDRGFADRDTGDFAEIESWPLRLVIFGEFRPRYGRDRSNSDEPHSYTIDKESFDEVLSRVAGLLPLEIRDSDQHISENQWIHLPLQNIRSFRPDAVVDAVPDLRELLVIRKRVKEFSEGKIPFEQLRVQIKDLREGARILDQLQTTEPVSVQKPKSSRKKPAPKKKPKSTQPDDLVDSILGMVDLPGAGRQEASISSAALERKSLISEIGESGAAGVTGKSFVPPKIMHELDGMLSAGVNRILHNPEFCRLEALWRGLKLLVDRTDFRQPIRIEIWPCAKANLPDSFTLFMNQVESGGGLDSDTVVLAVYEFDPSARDMESLRQLSGTAEVLQVPVISSVGLDFFGVDSAHALEQMSGLGGVFDQAQYTKWRALRETESSRWLVLLFNRFLLRYPYGPDQVRVKSFNYSESCSDSQSSKYLWGNPVWGMGNLLTKQFAARGNCLDVTGWENGLIEDLPIRQVGPGNGDSGQSPVETSIPETLRGDLSRQGIVTLVSKMNTDSAAILSAPTVHLPERYGDEKETEQARLRALLSFQLFVSRMAICAGKLADAINPGVGPDALSILIKEILLEFVPGKKEIEAIAVDIKDSVQFPDLYDVTLRLEPERAGWRLPSVYMQLQVPK